MQKTQPPLHLFQGNGFLIAASLALFFAVFLADWAAFRLWSTWEAVVPATTLFVFCSLLGATTFRREATLLFGIEAITAALTDSGGFLSAFLILVAISLASVVLAPLAAALALRFQLQ